MNLFVPSSWIDSEGAIQIAEARSALCTRSNPAADEGHETMTVFVLVRVIRKIGALAVSTAKTDQYPPESA